MCMYVIYIHHLWSPEPGSIERIPYDENKNDYNMSINIVGMNAIPKTQKKKTKTNKKKKEKKRIQILSWTAYLTLAPGRLTQESMFPSTSKRGNDVVELILVVRGSILGSTMTVNIFRRIVGLVSEYMIVSYVFFPCFWDGVNARWAQNGGCGSTIHMRIWYSWDLWRARHSCGWFDWCET